MAIKDNINAVIAVILRERANDPNGHSGTSARLQDKAIASIIAGQMRPGTTEPTTQWVTYMQEFAAGNPQQLARLTGSDGSLDAARQKERAYLVSNAICGQGTGDDLLDGDVTDNMDRLSTP